MAKVERNLFEYESIVMDALISMGYPKESIVLEGQIDARRFVDIIINDLDTGLRLMMIEIKSCGERTQTAVRKIAFDSLKRYYEKTTTPVKAVAAILDRQKVELEFIDFTEAVKENDYDRGEFDYYELIAADEMFSGCTELNKLIVRFNNVGKLKTLSKFAYNCKNVTTGNIAVYDSEVLTDLSYLFAQSSEDNQGALTDFDLSIYYKDSSVKNSGLQTVTTLEGLLSNCINLTALDMSTWNVSGLKTIKAMCYNNKNLKTIILADSYTFNLLEIAD